MAFQLRVDSFLDRAVHLWAAGRVTIFCPVVIRKARFMAAFTIDDFENIDFHIPDGKGKLVTISVPPLDCIAPRDLNVITKALEEDPTEIPVEITRRFLLHFATTKAVRDAVEELPARQMSQIDELWAKESGVPVGESEDSTATSAVETEN